MRYGQSLRENIAMCDWFLRFLNAHYMDDPDTGDAVIFVEGLRDGWRSELKDLNVRPGSGTPFDAQG